jgi:hypothetical protein
MAMESSVKNRPRGLEQNGSASRKRKFSALTGAEILCIGTKGHPWVAREHNQMWGFSRLHCGRCQAIKPGQLSLEEYLQAQQIPAISANSCGICLTPMTTLGDISCLPCGHQLHRTCLLPWFKINRSCPLCRKAVSTTDPLLPLNIGIVDLDGHHESIGPPARPTPGPPVEFAVVVD